MSTNRNETREQMLDRLWRAEEDVKKAAAFARAEQCLDTRERLRALPARFPLVAADRRSGDDRRVNVEHALAQPMPRRLDRDPQAIEASVAHLMRFARACAAFHPHADWIGLEAAIRKAISPPL